MALRAVSIVNLESSIRAQFDDQFDNIRRNLQVQEENRRVSSDSQQTINDEPNNEPPEYSSDNTSHDDMSDTGDLARPTELPLPPISRTTSMDIAVESPNFPTSPDLPDNGDTDSLDQEIERLSSNNTRNMTCCQFYRSHWIGHLVTGLISGSLFVLLGIVFLVQGSTSIPYYAGITLIILGLAPCCMAINRYRYVRLYERERRRALRRLGAMRREHRRNRRESRRRRRPEYSDLPPSYNNLGFDFSGEEIEIRIDDNISVASSFVLPSYSECVKKDDDSEDLKELQFTVIGDVEISNNNNNNNNQEIPDIRAILQNNTEVEINMQDIQIVDDFFEQYENEDSVSASSGDEDNAEINSVASNEDDTRL